MNLSDFIKPPTGIPSDWIGMRGSFAAFTIDALLSEQYDPSTIVIDKDINRIIVRYNGGTVESRKDNLCINDILNLVKSLS